VRHAAYCSRRIKQKGGEAMPLFTIMHIYEVPAKNQYAVTDELMIARKNHFDKLYLKKVLSGIKSMSLQTPKSLPNGERFSSGN
jgi:hypothetical protein